MLGCIPIKMYAIFWIDANGRRGNGEYILNEEALRSWLDYLRVKYPEMSHWGQTLDGERYGEVIPIPLTDEDPSHQS
jgi:hypothetical protein